MIHHDFLEYGIPMSSHCDQCVHFWQKVGCCNFSKCCVSWVTWKILDVEIWGNISEIFQQLLSGLLIQITVLRWSSVTFASKLSPRCSQEGLLCPANMFLTAVNIWTVSLLTHCEYKVLQMQSTFFMCMILWEWKYGLAMPLTRIKCSLRHIAL